MPQLTTITSNNGEPLYFKWPYQAKVIKILEQVNRTMGSQRDDVSSFINFEASSLAIHFLFFSRQMANSLQVGLDSSTYKVEKQRKSIELECFK